jgi:hypothetical protein
LPEHIGAKCSLEDDGPFENEGFSMDAFGGGASAGRAALPETKGDERRSGPHSSPVQHDTDMTDKRKFCEVWSSA